jgi:hypothetical protein
LRGPKRSWLWNWTQEWCDYNRVYALRSRMGGGSGGGLSFSCEGSGGLLFSCIVEVCFTYHVHLCHHGRHHLQVVELQRRVQGTPFAAHLQVGTLTAPIQNKALQESSVRDVVRPAASGPRVPERCKKLSLGKGSHLLSPPLSWEAGGFFHAFKDFRINRFHCDYLCTFFRPLLCKDVMSAEPVVTCLF